MQGDYQKLLPANMTVSRTGHSRRDYQSFENGQELEKELFGKMQRYVQTAVLKTAERKCFCNVQNEICALKMDLPC